VAAVEAESGKRLAEVLVKQLTGGDTITARYLYGEYFEYVPSFKVWLAVNHKPVVQATDYAIWRRIHVLPFTVTILQSKRDKRLMEKLQAELPGILRWAVEGCLAWQREELEAPPVVRRVTGDYLPGRDGCHCCVPQRVLCAGSRAACWCYRTLQGISRLVPTDR
jgi:putative DNA primase/helicase